MDVAIRAFTKTLDVRVLEGCDRKTNERKIEVVGKLMLGGAQSCDPWPRFWISHMQK